MPSRLFALDNPFLEAIHPQAETLQEYGRVWVQRAGLINRAADLARFDAAQYWQLIAGAYPQAPWELLTLALEWNVWGFILDDLDDASEAASRPEDLQRLFASIQAVLQDEALPANCPPFLQALAGIWSRMHLYSSSAWRQRFAQTLGESLVAYQWEAQNRVNHRTPPVAEYIFYRRKTGGWMTDLLLVDLSLGRLLPEQYYHHPALQELLDTANNIICWSNDLFSFEKESALGEVHNLVRVVQAEQHCAVDEAISAVVDCHNQEIKRWQKLKHLSFADTTPDFQHIQRYIQFCEHFIASNFAWSQRTGRYQKSIGETLPCLEPPAHMAPSSLPFAR